MVANVACLIRNINFENNSHCTNTPQQSALSRLLLHVFSFPFFFYKLSVKGVRLCDTSKNYKKIELR